MGPFGPSVVAMALATRTDRRPSMARTMWDSSVGKKTVMAVSGVIMLLYLVAHVIGNLKIFFGAEEFNHYGHWLRTVGEPFMPLSGRSGSSGSSSSSPWSPTRPPPTSSAGATSGPGPTRYVHKKPRASYATRTMRWGGVILGLFIVWHVLDLTTGTVHPGGFQEGHPYQNVVDTFSTWYGNVVYIAAMLALGLHIRHRLLERRPDPRRRQPHPRPGPEDHRQRPRAAAHGRLHRRTRGRHDRVVS